MSDIRKIQSSSNLNPEQNSAVHASWEPLLIIAGAGTGKTKTLTNRLAHLLNQGARPDKICAVTFTNKAAREMKERVNLLVPRLPKINGPFIGTFHSLGAQILRQESHALDRSLHFVIFDDNDSAQLIKKIFKHLNLKKAERGPADFLHAISNIKNGMLSLDELRNSFTPEDQNLVIFFDTYEERLKLANAFDFDDLIQKPVWLCTNKPELRAKYSNRFDHLLIDEYQDINRVQYDLIKFLAAKAQSLTAVGDDAQMIYGWRGSDLSIFLNFQKDWPKARTIFLEQNYRSTGTIVNAASSVVKHNTVKSTEWQNKILRTANPLGVPIRVTETSDAEAEADWIADEILSERRSREKTSAAILYRTNAQSRPLEQALIQREIPYHIFGGLKFYERKEIKDIIAGVRYALNPKDPVSSDRLSKNFTQKVLREWHMVLEDLPEERGSLPPLTLIGAFLKNTEYLASLRKNFTNAMEREENVAALIQFASNFEETTPLLEQISLLQANDETNRDKREPQVILLTVHLAKGLEFDQVYIAGANEGLLPHNRSLTTLAELEEERRLMYVAMTRARSMLAISFYDLPSRFLSELPADTIVYQNLANDRSLALDDEERYITLD